MERRKLKLPALSNNTLIWIVVLFIIIGFGKSSNALGINLFNTQKDDHKGGHKHYPDKRGSLPEPNKGGLIPISGLGGSRGFLAGNGLFLIAIIALLIICKDDKKEECLDSTPEVDYTEIDD